MTLIDIVSFALIELFHLSFYTFWRFTAVCPSVSPSAKLKIVPNIGITLLLLLLSHELSYSDFFFVYVLSSQIILYMSTIKQYTNGPKRKMPECRSAECMVFGEGADKNVRSAMRTVERSGLHPILWEEYSVV